MDSSTGGVLARNGAPRRVVGLAALALSTTLVAACSSSSPNAAPTTTTTKQASLTYQFVPFDHLDPQTVSDGEAITGENLLEGVVTPDAAGTGVVPATADAWTVTHGGTVYTFHIRSNAEWSDGTPVTAQDFEWTYKRLLTPSTRTIQGQDEGSSYQADLGIKNAESYLGGELVDWSKVGVRALDRAHLQITLEVPNASFLVGMSDISMVVLPRRNVEAHPFTWQSAAQWVGNGPFVVKSWTPNTIMVLGRNEHYWDRAHVQLNQVKIVSSKTTDADLVARYKYGRLDIARLIDARPFQQDPALAPGLSRLDQYSLQFLTLVPSRNQVLSDVRVREAISLAIDREAIAKLGDLTPATAIVPPGVPGFDASVGVTEDVAKARRLLAEAGYPGGKGFPTFSVLTYSDDPNVRALLASLHRNLGMNVAQDVEDVGVYSAKRDEVQPATFAGYYTNGYSALLTWRTWVSDNNPPSQTELLSLAADDYTHYEVLQAQGTARAIAQANDFLAGHASADTRRFAALAARADATADPEQATALYKQAAAVRQRTFEFIPYGFRSQVYLVRPGITGVHFWLGHSAVAFKGVRVAS